MKPIPWSTLSAPIRVIMVFVFKISMVLKV
jgi:hypothetical protein